MKNNGIWQSKCLTTESSKFKLECLCEDRVSDKASKDWVWLTFEELDDKEYPNQKMVWDNPDYIFGEFCDYLERKIEFKLTKEQIEEFNDVHEYLTRDLCIELLELLQTAKQLNWA